MSLQNSFENPFISPSYFLVSPRVQTVYTSSLCVYVCTLNGGLQTLIPMEISYSDTRRITRGGVVNVASWTECAWFPNETSLEMFIKVPVFPPVGGEFSSSPDKQLQACVQENRLLPAQRLKTGKSAMRQNWRKKESEDVLRFDERVSRRRRSLFNEWIERWFLNTHTYTHIYMWR